MAAPIKETLATYLPIDRCHALAGGSQLPDRSSGAALFADLSGFTPLTNSLVRELGPQRGAEEISRQLNQIYSALVAEVHRYRGSVIGFAGDAITCWFDDGGPRRPAAAAERAVACALAMQRAMAAFASVQTPGGATLTLALRVSVSAGPVRRFLVGNPAFQLIDTLAGATVDRLAAADHAAATGEVVIAPEVADALGDGVQIAAWRGEAGGPFAVVADLTRPVPPDPWPAPDLARLGPEELRPWLLPPVYARLLAGQGQFLAELRPAVALFLRFEGIDYDGDDGAGPKLDAFIHWVQQIVARYDGSLLQLSFGDKGSYFYCVFGAPLTHEDEAVRAAQAALLLRTPPAELDFITSAQIGISQGRMRTGAYGGDERLTYGVIGEEVNMAARLMQAAPPGQAYATLPVQQAAAARFAWEPLPPLHVKGRGEPLSAFRLLRAHERQPLHLQSAIYGLPMVGRGPELARMTAAMTEAIGGRGRIVAITAEAGLGKSRLLVEGLRLALDRGMTVHSGEAQSFGTNDSYLAWESVWQSFFGVDRAAPPEAQVARLGEALAAIDPELLPRLPLLGVLLNLPIPDNELTASLDSRLRKLSLEALLVACLRARSQASPTLIALEDAHWLDSLSHELLETLGRAIVDMPVLIVVAYRPPEIAYLRTPRVTALPHTTTIELPELAREEAAALIQLKLVHLDMSVELPAEVVGRLADRAQGNPFFIEELLNYLHARGLAPRSVAELEGLDLPEGLYSLVLSRIDQLSEHQKTTLKVASVIGRLFQSAWLWGVYPDLGGPPQVRADLEALSRMELTLLDQPEPDSVYLFKHILTHGVAYESLPFATRAWLHEQVAAYVERHYAGSLDQFVDLLAFHYDQSTNQPRRREYLRLAGEQAQAAYANTTAIDYYTRLLALLEPHEQGPVLLRLGQVRELVGEWAEAGDSYRQALALSEAAGAEGLVVACRRALGWLARKQGDYGEALRRLQQARAGYAALDDTAAAIQALADVGEVYRLQGDYAQAGLCYEESLWLAEAAARTPELLAARANALKGAGTLANQQGDPARARALYEESLAIRRELNDQPGIAVMLNNLGMVALFREEFAAAEPLFAESLALFRQIGDRWAAGQLLNNLGLAMRYNGRPEGARRVLEESVALRRSLGDKWGIANSLSTLANLLLHEGEHAELPAILRESLALNREVGDQVAVAYCLEDYAGLAAARARYVRALRLAGAAAALRAELGAPLPTAEQASLDGLLAPARAALGPAAETAFSEGRGLSSDDAVALALGD
jgi:adenylate cyclase